MDYKEEIIDHYKYPRNFGDLEDPKITIDESNSSCGDMVEIYVRLKERKNLPAGRQGSRTQEIETIKWRGVGCAISTAASSMLSEKAVGMSKDDLEKFGEAGVVALLGGEISAGRMKCATLAYRALMGVFSK